MYIYWASFVRSVMRYRRRQLLLRLISLITEGAAYLKLEKAWIHANVIMPPKKPSCSKLLLCFVWMQFGMRYGKDFTYIDVIILHINYDRSDHRLLFFVQIFLKLHRYSVSGYRNHLVPCSNPRRECSCTRVL